jgi:hypothetical protein
MRERTIAALVQLFKEKERKLEDWRDPRFELIPEARQGSADSSGETSPAIADGDESNLAAPWQPPPETPEPPAKELERPASFQAEATSQDEELAGEIQPEIDPLPHADPGGKPLAPSSLEIVDEIRHLKHERPLQRVQAGEEQPLTQTTQDQSPAEAVGKNIPVPAPPQQKETPGLPEANELEFKANVVRFPQVSPFQQITSPKKVDYKRLVEKKLEEHSEDLRNSEIKTVSIAQIKKYLYQEEYELCAHELENIQQLFPDSAEIQAFVENTSRRLNDLQRVKGFETLAKELMLSASFHYQQGKLPEALIATKEVLRVIPEHQQARQFAEVIQKRLDREKKKAMRVDKIRYCWACGVAVDSVSQYCYHCGHRLS